jgi:hypothetical protein
LANGRTLREPSSTTARLGARASRHDACSQAVQLEDAAQADPLSGVVARRSVDYLLRNTQQQLVALTGQADMKASIVITAASLVLSISATQWDRQSLRPSGGGTPPR